MSVTGQAGNPERALSVFLEARLPQRDVVAQAWARQAESAPWSGIETDLDWLRQLGSAIEIRIGLDVATTPGYWDVLSFLSPEECRALLSAAGYSADGREDLADTGTSHSPRCLPPQPTVRHRQLQTSAPSSGPRSGRRPTTPSPPACATAIRHWQARRPHHHPSRRTASRTVGT